MEKTVSRNLSKFLIFSIIGILYFFVPLAPTASGGRATWLVQSVMPQARPCFPATQCCFTKQISPLAFSANRDMILRENASLARSSSFPAVRGVPLYRQTVCTSSIQQVLLPVD